MANIVIHALLMLAIIRISNKVSERGIFHVIVRLAVRMIDAVSPDGHAHFGGDR